MWRALKRGRSWAFIALSALGGACGESASAPPVGPSGSAGTPSPSFGGALAGGSGGAAGGALRLDCVGPLPPSPLTRWAMRDLDNALDDVFGPGTSLRSILGTREVGYDRDLSFYFAQALRVVARERARAAVSDDEVLEVCGEADSSDACLEPWLRTWGEALYRRPLTAEQTSAYVVQFDAARRTRSDAEAARNTLVSMILSPYFVFRIELGDSKTGRLTGDELALRLSRFATGHAPDAELRALATSGALSDPATLLAQLHRLWASPTGQAARARQQLERLGLDADLPLGAGAPLRAEMLTQTSALINDVFENHHGSLAALLTSSRHLLSPVLAEHYGLPAPAADGASLVDLDPSLFSGILAEGLFLSTYQRPSARGRAIVQGLLCTTVPDQPAVLQIELGSGPTPREQVNESVADKPVCVPCHQLIDPPGFALEAFDGDGRLTGFDTSGAVQLDPIKKPAPVAVANPHELGLAVARSPRGQACAAIDALAHLLDRPLVVGSMASSTGAGPPVPLPAERYPDEELAACLRSASAVGDFDYITAAELVIASPAFSQLAHPPRRIVAFDTSVDAVEHAWQETAQFRGVFAESGDEQTLALYLEALRQLQERDRLPPAGAEGGEGGQAGGGAAAVAGAGGAP